MTVVGGSPPLLGCVVTLFKLRVEAAAEQPDYHRCQQVLAYGAFGLRWAEHHADAVNIDACS